jgi:hypothetical protein
MVLIAPKTTRRGTNVSTNCFMIYNQSISTSTKPLLHTAITHSHKNSLFIQTKCSLFKEKNKIIIRLITIFISAKQPEVLYVASCPSSSKKAH